MKKNKALSDKYVLDEVRTAAVLPVVTKKDARSDSCIFDAQESHQEALCVSTLNSPFKTAALALSAAHPERFVVWMG